MSQLRPSISNNFRSSGIFSSRSIPEPQEIAQSLCKHFPYLHLSATDITKPTCEKVCEIYHCIAEKVMKIAPATFSVPPLAAMPDGGCDSELFGGVIPKIVIFTAMSALLEDISESPGPLFGMNDLILPDPKSTRHFLSILVDFLEFSDKANKEVEYAFSLHDGKKAELQNLEREILDKASELEKLRSDSKNRKRMANEIREQLDQVIHSSQNLKEEIDAMQESYKGDEAEVKELKTKIDNCKKELEKLTAQMEVSSLEDQLQSVKERLNAKRRDSADLHCKKRTKLLAAKAIEKILEKLKNMELYKGDLTQKEEIINELYGTIRRVQDELHSVNKLIKAEEDKSAAFDLTFQRGYEQHKQELTRISEQLQVMEKAATNLRHRMENVNKENLAVQNEIGTIKGEMASTLRSVEAKLQKLTSWLNTVLKQADEERSICNEEESRFLKMIGLLNDAVDGEITESSDTFTLPPRHDRSLQSTDRECLMSSQVL